MKQTTTKQQVRNLGMLVVFIIFLGMVTSWAQSPEPLNRDYDITLVEVKDVVQVDSISIFIKGKAGLVGKVYLKEDLMDELDFLSKKYKTYTFNVVKYYPDGLVIQCRIEKKVDFNINN